MAPKRNPKLMNPYWKPTMKIRLSALSLASLLVPAHAQVDRAPSPKPTYDVPAAARPGDTIQLGLVGQPGRPFATYLDLNGDSNMFGGEEIFLALSPALALIDNGTLDSRGMRKQTIKIPKH